MQCPSCRQEASGAFCNLCGATLAAAPGGSAIPATATGSGLTDNAAAAIAYLTIIPSIIFLLIEPYNKIRLVRFHSIQNIALAVVGVALWIALMILQVIVTFIPIIGLLFVLVDIAVAVVFFIAWLMALIKASKGEYFKLPFIGDYAAKMAGN
jgi:uncharacterized membrane protein